MALKRAKDEGKLSKAAFSFGVTLLVPAYLMDILGNLIICTVLFLDWPRETLITGRIQRYVDGPDEYSYPHDGWRWFDSEDQARGYFGIQEKLNNPSISA